MPGKRVQFDEETWRQIDLLGHDQMKDFQELADEAFRDLLKKHDRPVDLKDALRRSAGVSATIHELRPGATRKRRKKEQTNSNRGAPEQKFCTKGLSTLAASLGELSSLPTPFNSCGPASGDRSPSFNPSVLEG